MWIKEGEVGEEGKALVAVGSADLSLTSVRPKRKQPVGGGVHSSA